VKRARQLGCLNASSVVLSLLSAVLAPLPTGEPSRTPVPVVRLPFPAEDGSLSPYSFKLGYPLMTLVYDTLLWRDRDGVPQPWLARAVDVSPDGRVVTIRLADNAHWQDGPPVTSRDVVFTFGFVATHPHPRFTAELSAVQSVEAPDPATVEITLRHPSPGFIDQPLADLPILPRHLWQSLPRGNTAPDGLPVGSGPYRLVEHIPGERYRFEANSGYFQGRPTVDALEVPVIGDADAQLRALHGGGVDMVPLSLSADAAAGVEVIGTRLAKGRSYLGTVLMFNLRRPPFDRAEVRQAVAEALDLEQMARVVGGAVPADHGYLHPASAWGSGRILHTSDEATARRALAGLGAGTIKVLVADNDPLRLKAARQVALDLDRVGLQTVVSAIPAQDLSQAVGEDGSAASFQAAIWSSSPLGSYDPDFLGRVFGADPTTATFNYSGYASREFDSLSAQVETAQDVAARRSAVERELQLLATDLPVVPLFFADGIYAYRPGAYDGWVFVKGAGILDKASFVGPASIPTSPTSPSTNLRPPPEGVSHKAGWPLAGAGLVAVAISAAVIVGRRRHGAWPM